MDEGQLENASDGEVVQLLVESGVNSVVLTLGSKGALVGERLTNGEIKITQIDSVTTAVVDTVGAGDAFVGVLAAGLSSGLSLLDSAKEANVFAAATVGFPGAQASYLPARESLKMKE